MTARPIAQRAPWIGGMGLVAGLAGAAAAQAVPTARADGEELEGGWVTSSRSIAAFRGIPYAAPPTGQRRWAPPARHPGGSARRVAREAGPSCPQDNRLDAFERSITAAFGRERDVQLVPRRTSEDCLFLDVWTPNLGGRTGPLPVMVWIHGGSNISGEGSSPWYDGTRLAARGVVVVTINYRLGVLGFLAHPALSAESPQRASGNYALLDQVAALEWVRRNIAGFGGDTSRVTLFGESAGALDLLHLVASPLARGLVHRAIAQSGPAMGQMTRLAQAERAGVALAAAVGLDSTATAEALRAVPVERLLAAADSLRAAGRFATDPIVDGHVLPDVTGRRFDRGEQLGVPLLIGTNAHEMTTLRYYLPRFERTPKGFRGWLATLGPVGAALGPLYPAETDADVEPALVALTTDLFFTCPSRFAARAVAQSGQSAWLYHFTRVPPGGDALGAYHSAEIGYVFDTRQPWLPSTPEDRALIDAMMGYWVRFAATGDPNGDGSPAWPRYDAESNAYLELGSGITAGRDLDDAACDRVDAGIRFLWGPPVR